MFQAIMWGPETISISATQDDSGGKKMKKIGSAICQSSLPAARGIAAHLRCLKNISEKH